MTMTIDRPVAKPRVNGTNLPAVSASPTTALARMADRFLISQTNLVNVIKKTCIKGPCTDEEFQAFVIVCDTYDLNPILREIHAFADPRRGIVPIVGIDGWAKIVNERGNFDGCDFAFDTVDGDLACTCTMHVKGRSHPVSVTEWHSECKRNTPPWQQMKRRMLRHKAFMQAARLAFSLSGIYDEDEASDIRGGPSSPTVPAFGSRTQGVLAKVVTSRPVSEGHSFVPDEDADERVARQDAHVAEAAVDPAQHGGDDLDASGADTGEPPPADHDANPFASWAGTMAEAARITVVKGWGDDGLQKRVDGFLLKKRCKGSPEKLTQAQRAELVATLEAEEALPGE